MLITLKTSILYWLPIKYIISDFEANYKIILNELQKLEFNDNCYFKPIKPNLSDLELVAINITAEFLSIDSEYQLFRNLKGTCLCDRIERSVYNKRKRKLFNWMEEIRKELVFKFNEF